MWKFTNQKCKWLFSLFLLSFYISNTIIAQTTIITYLSSEDLIVAYKETNSKIRIDFTGNCAGSQVMIKLPNGVSYANNLVKTAGSSNLNISTNVAATTPQNIVLDISGNVNSGSFIEFSFDRRATCLAESGAAFDTVSVISSCSPITINDPMNQYAKSYNIYKPVLTIVPPAALNNINIRFDTVRTSSILLNGNNTKIDTLYYYIYYKNGAIQNNNNGQIVANGITLSPANVSNYTFY